MYYDNRTDDVAYGDSQLASTNAARMFASAGTFPYIAESDDESSSEASSTSISADISISSSAAGTEFSVNLPSGVYMVILQDNSYVRITSTQVSRPASDDGQAPVQIFPALIRPATAPPELSTSEVGPQFSATKLIPTTDQTRRVLGRPLPTPPSASTRVSVASGAPSAPTQIAPKAEFHCLRREDGPWMHGRVSDLRSTRQSPPEQSFSRWIPTHPVISDSLSGDQARDIRHEDFLSDSQSDGSTSEDSTIDTPVEPTEQCWYSLSERVKRDVALTLQQPSGLHIDEQQSRFQSCPNPTPSFDASVRSPTPSPAIRSLKSSILDPARSIHSGTAKTVRFSSNVQVQVLFDSPPSSSPSLDSDYAPSNDEPHIDVSIAQTRVVDPVVTACANAHLKTRFLPHVKRPIKGGPRSPRPHKSDKAPNANVGKTAVQRVPQIPSSEPKLMIKRVRSDDSLSSNSTLTPSANPQLNRSPVPHPAANTPEATTGDSACSEHVHMNTFGTDEFVHDMALYHSVLSHSNREEDPQTVPMLYNTPPPLRKAQGWYPSPSPSPSRGSGGTRTATRAIAVQPSMQVPSETRPRFEEKLDRMLDRGEASLNNGRPPPRLPSRSSVGPSHSNAITLLDPVISAVADPEFIAQQELLLQRYNAQLEVLYQKYETRQYHDSSYSNGGWTTWGR